MTRFRLGGSSAVSLRAPLFARPLEPRSGLGAEGAARAGLGVGDAPRGIVGGALAMGRFKRRKADADRRAYPADREGDHQPQNLRSLPGGGVNNCLSSAGVSSTGSRFFPEHSGHVIFPTGGSPPVPLHLGQMSEAVIFRS